MILNNRIKEKLRDLPEKSGVYLMKDIEGNVIYVGKAKVLKNRVKSYFNGAHEGKVAVMVSRIEDVEWIITESENEAFALEVNLIKEYMPKYNIMLRDDKHYPYIKINVKSDYPKLTVVRRVKNDGSKYYGPYFSATSMRNTIEAVRKIFPIRSCNLNIAAVKGKMRPCLNYDIGRCIAPCKADVTKEEYNSLIEKMCNFLDGNDENLTNEMVQKMQHAAQRQDYEEAARYRDIIEDITKTLSFQQRVILNKLESYDIIGTASKNTKAIACIMVLRGGKIIGSENIPLDVPMDSEEGEIIQYFIKSYYTNSNTIPLNILISHDIEDSDELEGFLSGLREGPVHIRKPVKGEKKRLLDMAVENAASGIDRSIEHDKRRWDRTGGAVVALQKSLNLKKLPKRIEAYDISNIQGVDSVASMVVFVDGMPNKKSYRRFKIKTVEGANDFASMAEVIHRRFKRGLEEKEKGKYKGENKFSYFPDLVVIDGGKGQLSAARKSMEDLEVDYLETIGLAKREEEVFFPNQSEPVIISKASPALHLLQRIRDEAHRFAITYHRSLRQKGTLLSELDGIEGIGPARRRALLTAFPTISAIKNATVDELREVEGMNIKSAQAIFEHYHKKTNSDETPL